MSLKSWLSYLFAIAIFCCLCVSLCFLLLFLFWVKKSPHTHSHTHMLVRTEKNYWVMNIQCIYYIPTLHTYKSVYQRLDNLLECLSVPCVWLVCSVRECIVYDALYNAHTHTHIETTNKSSTWKCFDIANCIVLEKFPIYFRKLNFRDKCFVLQIVK